MGACFEVYKVMGCGFVEPVYQECLELELAAQQIPFRPQAELGILYKGRELKQKYVPDFICFDSVIIEIKAVSELCNAHRAQDHNYLNATGYRLGILINFGSFPKVEYERIIV